MYEAAAHLAGTWGLVFLLVLFLVAVGWALWPGHRETFERASRQPLEDDEEEDRQ